MVNTRLSVDQVLAWRLKRQLLEPRGTANATICQRLCGVQAQVASAAALAVASRQDKPKLGEVSKALADRLLVKTWAMRGTLHLLPAGETATYLSLLAAARTWERGSWQRAFVSAKQLDAITSAVREVLHNRVLTRDQLVAEVLELTGEADVADHLESGWSAVLKPLAWQGFLCQGPAEGNRVTFTSPETWFADWAGLPSAEEAAAAVIPAYLGAYGPATSVVFDAWLTRGKSKKSELRRWFADLSRDLVTVDVEGTQAYARAADVDEIAATEPSKTVRLLPGFDQYVLGPGTGDTSIIATKRRAQISRIAGWISPVVIAGGRVAGTWEIADEAVAVVLFSEADKVATKAIEAEVDHLSKFTGNRLGLSISTK